MSLAKFALAALLILTSAVLAGAGAGSASRPHWHRDESPIVTPLDGAHTAGCMATLQTVGFGPRGRAVVPLGNLVSIKAMRPASLRIDDIKHRKVSGTQQIVLRGFDVFVTDGKRQYLASGKRYYPGIAASKLSDIDPRSIASIAGDLGIDILFRRRLLQGFVLKSKGALEGEAVLIYTLRKGGMYHDEDYVLYLSQKTHLPVRISHGPDEHGKMAEHDRVTYSDWRLNVALPASVFDTIPPAGAKKMAPP